MTGEVPSLGKAAQAFVGAIIEGAEALTESVVACLSRGSISLDDPAREQLRIRCLLYLLHVTDRFALAQLRFAGREQFMAALLAELVRDVADPAPVRTEYNAFQHRYGAYKLFPEGSGGYGGTLCWEFAKSLVAEFCPNDVLMIPILTLAAYDMVEAVGKTFRQCVPDR